MKIVIVGGGKVGFAIAREVSAEGHAEPCLTLVCQAAQEHLPAALAVYDAGLARNGSFRQRHILSGRYGNNVGIYVFSQNTHSFQNADGGAIAPPPFNISPELNNFRFGNRFLCSCQQPEQPEQPV
mgnify:CR=1 FL=1